MQANLAGSASFAFGEPDAKRGVYRRGSGFEAIEIDSGRGNPHAIPRTADSVLTLDLVDEAGHPTREALDRVLSFFAEQLRSA